jgi:alpha-beta hydrolase superfamily lysophospholipase
VDALVLSSPALDPGLNAVQKLLLAVVPALAPQLAVHNGLKPAWISRDPAVVQAYVNDPLVHDRITGRLARFIADAGLDVLAAAPRWTVPTLLMWAGADRCVAPRGSAQFAATAPAAVLSAREWPGLAHEIFNEPEQAEVLAALSQWLQALPTGAKSAPSPAP